MNDYETRFRKWLGNTDETHFFNRLLRSLKLLMPELFLVLKARIIEETKCIIVIDFFI